MLLKPPFQIPRLFKTRLVKGPRQAVMGLKKKYWYALGLGLLGNFLVNLLFDLKYQRELWGFNFEEYYLAVAISLILLSINQGLTGIISRRIKDASLAWFGAYFLSSLICLNTLVVGITYGFYHSFYSLSDLLIINLCFVPLSTFLSLRLRKEFINKLATSGFWAQWKWISSVLLGISVNTLINLIFDYKYQRALISTSLEEYLNAIVAAHLLLNGTRWISRKLDKRYPWRRGVIKRLLWQTGLQFVFILISLNTLVIGITYLFYGGGYQTDELLIINMSMIILTILFSGIDSSIYFYQNWSSASSSGPVLVADKAPKSVLVSMGKSKHLIEQSEIDFAISQSGLTLIHTKDGRKMPYSQSLGQLHQALDPTLFFKANRQVILHRSVIKSYKSLPYGKLEVEVIVKGLQTMHISRTKATEFRKWVETI